MDGRMDVFDVFVEYITTVINNLYGEQKWNPGQQLSLHAYK